jgi:hypothetical protein
MISIVLALLVACGAADKDTAAADTATHAE